MGLNIRDALIEYFEGRGMVLDDTHYYSLNDIENQLRSLFGEEATEILMDKIEGEIHAQYYQ